MSHAPLAHPVDAGLVLTKAVTRAAHRLGLTQAALAACLGVSEATASRLRSGSATLQPEQKAFELAALLVRVFRSLDAVTGGDEAVARAWLKSENSVLGGRPLDRIRSVEGLVDVLAHLDAARARL